MGADYQVYVCVAVLTFLQQKLLLHTQTQQLQVFLKVSHQTKGIKFLHIM